MKKSFSALALSLSLITTLSMAAPALAVSPVQQACEGANVGNPLNSSDCSSQAGLLPDKLKTIINIFLFIVGAVAVFMVIVGGFRMVISSGNPEAMKGARNTVLFAVIGVAVTLLAYAIVNFVIANIG